MKTIKLGIFVSGSGSSAQALFENIKKEVLSGYEIAVIICNRPPGKAGIYNRKEAMPDTPIVYASHKDPEAQLEVLKTYKVDICIGLGYLPLIPSLLLKAYKDCFLNIHSGDTKKYGGTGMYGTHVHKAVLTAKEKKTYPTVHLMNENYDEGRILMQLEVDIPLDIIGKKAVKANVEKLQKHVLHYEYSLMVEVLRCIVEGNIHIGILPPE